MTLQAYSLRRQEHRQRLAAHRRQRTTNLGPHMRLQFEDELTVRHQIQEVLWADRGARLFVLRTPGQERQTLAPR